MEEKLLDGDATPNLESLHKVRLTALLNDLIKQGKLEAAQLLGINHKTLSAALDSGTLTPRVSDALEKVLLSRQIEAFEKVRERVDELEGQVGSGGRTDRELRRRDRGGRSKGGGAPRRGVDGNAGRRGGAVSRDYEPPRRR